jgi:hypothetical protein
MIKKKRRTVTETEPKKAMFLAAYVSNLGNIARTCKELDIVRGTYYQWMKKDVKFKTEFRRACKELEEDLAEKAMTFANAGDTTLIIFMLKALNRSKYDDAFARQKHAIKEGRQPDGSLPTVTRAVFAEDELPPQVANEPEPSIH